jgi:DNA polymerase (family 10)
MKNKEVADILYEIADYLEIEDVQFKPRAYRQAARNIESLSEDIEAIHERDELDEIDGVGESIAEKIAEFLETGSMEYYQDLREELPIDIEAITSVEGVGPKTAKELYQKLGVATLEELKAAAEQGKIAELDGFGEKSQAKILDHIELARRSQERMLLGRAFPIAHDVESRLSNSPAFDRVDIVGSFRRRRATVGDIDILATAQNPTEAMEVFCAHKDVKEVLGRGETKSSVLVAGDLQMDLRIVDDESYGAGLVYFTGSKDHNIRLRNRAIDRDWKLNEYGLFDVSDVDSDESGQRIGEQIAGETEDDIYDRLDVEWIPPVLREDTGEVDAAAASELPELVSDDEIRGDLQMHTEYSDGSASVEEMAEAADDRGYEYIAITDHGPGAPIPSRMDVADFEAQRREIEATNENESIETTVLNGIEAEITDDGLGISREQCQEFDVVVAALHDTPDDPTDRIIEALSDYPVDVFAHPTNRLINERDPLELDFDAIATAVQKSDIAIEINAQPARLDLDWRLVKEYRDQVRFIISTDAHTTGELGQMHLGVSQAQRGWCEAADIRNTAPVTDVVDWLDRPN